MRGVAAVRKYRGPCQLFDHAHRARPAVGPYGLPPNEHLRRQCHLEHTMRKEFTVRSSMTLFGRHPRSNWQVSSVYRTLASGRFASSTTFPPPLGYWAKLSVVKPVFSWHPTDLRASASSVRALSSRSKIVDNRSNSTSVHHNPRDTVTLRSCPARIFSRRPAALSM